MDATRGSLLLLVILASLPTTVQAQDVAAPLGATRQLVISLERALGFAYGSTVVEARGNAVRLEESGTAVGPPGANALVPRFAVPRLALDAFLGRRFSVGLGFGYVRRSSETTFVVPNPDGSTFTGVTKSSAKALVLVARGGYLVRLSPALSLWPRVGFTYLRTNRSAPPFDYGRALSHETFVSYALTVEAPIAVRIVDHVVATGGPTLDLGLKGVLERQEDGPPVANRPAREIDVGVSLGLAGYF